MKVSELLKIAKEAFQQAGIETPQLDAEVLLCHHLQWERIQLHMYPEREISREICLEFLKSVEKRKTLIPIQYLVNRQEFMGFDFYVDERVLIPRGDTEILVEAVIEQYQRDFSNTPLKLLELGVGSGAIALSLAKLLPQIQVTAVDISPGALEVAKINAQSLGVEARVTFLLGDLFSPLGEEEQAFGMIVSNPPYIPRDVVHTLSPQVKDYEPLNALDGGLDGLDFYRRITEEAYGRLIPGGWLAVEIGYDQGPAVLGLMEAQGYGSVTVLQDLAGHDRVVKGRRS